MEWKEAPTIHGYYWVTYPTIWEGDVPLKPHACTIAFVWCFKDIWILEASDGGKMRSYENREHVRFYGPIEVPASEYAGLSGQKVGG